MKVMAVIPVHNRREITMACLARLEASSHDGFELGVIVVDDGSTDGTGEAVTQMHGQARLIHGDGNLWWSGAMNLGVESALKQGCDYVLCLNDDTLFDAGLVRGLVEEAGRHPATLVAPQAVYDESGELMQSGYEFAPGRGWTASHSLRVLSEAPYWVQGLAGACVLIPAAAFRAVGFYAASELPQYHADIEFSARAGRAGFPSLVLPHLRLRVRRNVSFRDLLRDPLSWKALKAMFRWPGGVYAPRAFTAFYRRSHPSGPLAGLLYAAFFYAKLGPKIALNLMGLGKFFR